MTTNEQLAAKVKAITVFMLENRGRCFEDWCPAKVFRYVAFQLLNGTLFTAHDEKGNLALVVIAWPDDAEKVKARAEAGLTQFVWENPKMDGDCFLIGSVVGNRRYLQKIWEQVSGAWPESPRKKLFTYRRGKLSELTWKTIARLACHG